MGGASERVELQLLLHVALRHLPQCLLVLPQQQKDGRQLLLLHPGKSATTHTRPHIYTQLNTEKEKSGD